MKPQLLAGAPLPLGGHDAGIASSSVVHCRDMPELSGSREHGVLGLAEDTAASVVPGMTGNRQAQSTEHELDKLTTEVKKWEVVRNALV